MTDLKNASPRDSKSVLNDSQPEKCESVLLASGPPFDQRDYMISPSESSSSCVSDKSVTVKKKTKYGPGDLKIESKYILSSEAALQKLVELIRNGCIQPFMRRIKNLISKYLQGRTSGYLLKDIPLIVEAVEYFARNRTSYPEFSEFVVFLLCFAKNPPIVENTSDILRSKKILTDYFTLFGELLATFEEECFQIKILEALECLVFRRELSALTAVKLSTRHEAVEESQLPYVIAVLMETISYKLYFSYLDVAIQIIMVSLKAGQTMIQRNILNFILRRLNYCPGIDLTLEFPNNIEEEAILNEYYLLLEKSSYLIWGLLTIISKHDIDTPVPSECALRSLRIVFERESIKKSQKALDARNNLAGLLVKLCAVFREKLALIESGLLVDIALVSVGTEIKTENTWLEACKLGTKPEDYLFKKLMLLCCCLIKDKKSIEVLKNFKVIEGILQLINPEATSPWIPSQFINLFYVGLRTLSELAPVLPEVFVLQKGNSRLLSAMKLFMDQHFDRDALLELLKTFCTIATCENNRCIIDDIVAQDGVQTILELSSYLVHIKSIKLEDQEKLIRIFVVLETILRNNQKLLIKYHELCTTVAITLLKRVVSDSSCDSKWNPNLLVSFGGFLWEAIAWCRASLDAFVKQEGIFLLLDIIEKRSFPVQMLFLGILVDIIDEGKGIAHVNTWRGKNGFGILDLMIEIWRKEEQITKVHRTKDGIIQDVEMPLMTEEQWYLTHQIRGGHYYSPSVAEMVCSARPKIHAIYQFLQHRYFDLTSISESCYCLYLKNVRPSNQTYIPLIEHFLALKMGEVWFEVLRDINISGVIPTAYDGQIVCTLLDEKNNWSSRIKTMQEEILVMQRKGFSGEENQLYGLLKEFRIASALEALRELDYVARTSVQKFQEQKKQKQIHDLDKSLGALSLSPDIHIHRTFLYKTNITCFCANYAKIKSEKGATEKEDTVMVSSESSDDNRFEIDGCF